MDKTFIDSLRKKATDLAGERERLQNEIQKANARLTAVVGAIQGIDQLLKLEDAESSPIDDEDASEGESLEAAGLPAVLETVMSDKKYRTLDEVIDAVKATGFDFGEKNPKKTVGFTLLGLKRGARFLRSDAGKWIFVG